MQENSLSKNRAEAGADVIGSPNGKFVCNAARPRRVLFFLPSARRLFKKVLANGYERMD